MNKLLIEAIRKTSATSLGEEDLRSLRLEIENQIESLQQLIDVVDSKLTFLADLEASCKKNTYILIDGQEIFARQDFTQDEFLTAQRLAEDATCGTLL